MIHRVYSDLNAAHFPAEGRIGNIPGVGYLWAWGTTVPTDGETGYATGCLFQHTDGGNNTALYCNEGDTDSCDFNVVTVS